ncbi:MAG TPA: hypothetical protein VHX88_08650 [Solirubrobacteraceae bacterium]|jgi:hypothetical protein|nr:hypothetical protein [Solirubrobacteraceae bacterium]
MRSHGISNFPDPTTPAGGGVTFQIDAGRGSDLSQRSPAFQAADRACRSLLAAGRAAPPVSGPQLAQEVKWARCLRSHGLPGFPDPNGQGAFDSAGFDPESPRFAAASAVCRAEQPSGAISAAPGPRP